MFPNAFLPHQFQFIFILGPHSPVVYINILPSLQEPFNNTAMCVGKRSWQFLNYLSSVLYLLPVTWEGLRLSPPPIPLLCLISQWNLVADSPALFHSQDHQPNHGAPSLIMWLALPTSHPLCTHHTEEPDGRLRPLMALLLVPVPAPHLAFSCPPSLSNNQCTTT